MKFVLQLIILMILSYVLLLFGPWWIVAVAGFGVGYMLPSRASFLAGFIGVGFVWLLKAYLEDAGSSSALGTQVAGVIGVSTAVLYLVTATIGGLVGGFGTLSGSLLKGKKKTKY